MPHEHDDHNAHSLLPSEPALRVRALETILTRKGLVSAETLDEIIDVYAHKIGPHIGAKIVARAWIDPDFNPQQSAFYYVRVLQIPTPRNGLLDSIALQLDQPPRGPKTIQERAYTSPIWFRP